MLMQQFYTLFRKYIFFLGFYWRINVRMTFFKWKQLLSFFPHLLLRREGINLMLGVMLNFKNIYIIKLLFQFEYWLLDVNFNITISNTFQKLAL